MKLKHQQCDVIIMDARKICACIFYFLAILITTITMSSTLTISQGPTPTILSRKQIDALYETLESIINALSILNIPYILTGGSLLGAVRQHSILFCDDDIDVTIIDGPNGEQYRKLSTQLSTLLGKEYFYSKRPWEGGDKVRPKRMSNVFVDIFTMRQYNHMDDLIEVIKMKKNGMPQSEEYIKNIKMNIEQSAFAQGEILPLRNFWHFNERKAIEMWPKEVYRNNELFPLCHDFKFGPLTNVSGPRMPILLLRRAFGLDCFHVYYQSGSHHNNNTTMMKQTITNEKSNDNDNNTSTLVPNCNDISSKKKVLKPIVLEGGNWSNSSKVPLSDEQYIPMQPISKTKRRFTIHNKETLSAFIESQTKLEEEWKNNVDT